MRGFNLHPHHTTVFPACQVFIFTLSHDLQPEVLPHFRTDQQQTVPPFLRASPICVAPVARLMVSNVEQSLPIITYYALSSKQRDALTSLLSSVLEPSTNQNQRARQE